MGKRGNENSQLSKEEYDALEMSQSGGAAAAVSGGFARATPEEMAKRRIVRRARKPAGSTIAAPTAGGGGGGAISGSSSSGGGIFAGINFGGGGGGASSSSAAPPPSSSMATSMSSKPKFAMPSSSSSASGNKNPFGSISLAPPSAPSTNDGAFSGGSAIGSSSKGSVNGPMLESQKLLQKFQEFTQTWDIRRDHTMAAKRFVTTMLVRLQSEQQGEDEKARRQQQGNSMSNSNSIGGGGNASIPSLFASKPPPATAAAAAPVAFSFAAAPAGSSSASSTNKPTFAFGSSAPTTSTSARSPAAASPPASSGFSFAPAPTSSTPVPGSNFKIALSPVPAPSISTNGGAGGGTAEDDSGVQPEGEEKTEALESADGDWNTLMTVKVRAYHYRSEDGLPKKFASGSLKVQELKANAKVHRMVLRDLAGKVLLNVGISKGMTFTNTAQKVKPGARPASSIMFMGINGDEAARGIVERFSLLAAVDDATKLHTKCQEWSA